MDFEHHLLRNNALSGAFAYIGYHGTRDSAWINSGNVSPTSGVDLLLHPSNSITILIDNPEWARVAFPTGFSASKVSYMRVTYA